MPEDRDFDSSTYIQVAVRSSPLPIRLITSGAARRADPEEADIKNMRICEFLQIPSPKNRASSPGPNRLQPCATSFDSLNKTAASPQVLRRRGVIPLS